MVKNDLLYNLFAILIDSFQFGPLCLSLKFGKDPTNRQEGGLVDWWVGDGAWRLGALLVHPTG